MNRIQQKNAGIALRGNDPIVNKGLRQNTPVSVPLDVLSGLAAASKRHLELRPPKLKLQRKKQNPEDLADARPVQDILPLVSKETEETTLDIAQLVMRRQSEIMASGSPSAKAGLASLERMMRMFEHVYMLDTGMHVARAKS